MAGLLSILESPVTGVLHALGVGAGPAAAPAAYPPPAAAGGAPGGPAAPPPMSPRGYMHPTRDAILSFLGGGAGRLDQQLQAQDALKYQQDRNAAIYNMLPTPELKTAFSLSPQEFTTNFLQTYAPHLLKGGETELMGGPGGTTYTAPLLTHNNGRYATQTVDGAAETGSSGPELEAKDNLLIDKTGKAGQGGLVGTYSSPQQVAPGNSPSTFTPTVNGLGGPPASAPRIGAPAAAPAAGPALPAAQPPASMGAAGATLPRGLRNMNPGNLKPIRGGWSGQVGTDPAGYAVFGSIEDGLHAADANLASYGRLHGIDTIRGVVQRWAPQGTGGNHPDAYAAAVSRLTGIAPDQKIDLTNPQVRQQLLPAIFQVENGRPVDPQQLQGAPPAAAASQPAAASAQPAGWNVGQPNGRPEILAPAEVQKLGYAPGTVVERDPAGHLTVSQPPQWGSSQALELQKRVLDSQEYKQAQAAMAAYNAMKANASSMTGPSAYAMLDTFARAINPGAVARPTVIHTITENLGLPAKVVGSLDSAAGRGNLPKETRQQILDAVLSFVQTHWEQANSLNQANVEAARRHPELNAQDVVAPLEGRPERYVVQDPMGSQANPIRPKSADDLKGHPKGSYFVNPADGRLMITK